MRPDLLLVVAVTVSPTFSIEACLREREFRAALDAAGPLVILQRPAQTAEIGNVYQSHAYTPGARLLRLEKGQRSVLCCGQFPEMVGLDIQSYDVAFDARSIVFAGRIAGDEHYGLYLLPLDAHGLTAGPPDRLPTNPRADVVYPVFGPRDRIFFVTTESLERGVPQLDDELQRERTTQLGSIRLDGSDLHLGPRSLSHRVAPAVLSSGRILFTQWESLGQRDSGNLFSTTASFSDLRRESSSEGGSQVNSYLKAVEIEPDRVVSVGTARGRTLQSGKLLDLHLGRTSDDPLCRLRSSAQVRDLTPDVPESGPSTANAGRYFSASPLPNTVGPPASGRFLLVSWAGGPVFQGGREGAPPPDFGVYLYDSARRTRLPVLDDADSWDILPRPLARRSPPAGTDDSQPSADPGSSLLIGSVDVRRSTAPRGEAIVGVRLLEGFSDEEGAERDFGLGGYDGSARLGEAPVHPDGSWAALVPAGIPIRLQMIDRFGMAIVNEPVWLSGRPGETRVCGGGDLSVTQAGASPERFDRPRSARRSDDFSPEKVVGVPWNLAVQPIFDAKCSSCHDGSPGPANPSLTLTDQDGNSQTITLDLRRGSIGVPIGGEMISGYSASHLSLLGVDLAELDEGGLTVTGDLPAQIEPGSARRSLLFEKLNPPQRDGGSLPDRLFPGRPIHPVDVGGEELTAAEYALLILMADSGGQFYSRENSPGQSGY